MLLESLFHCVFFSTGIEKMAAEILRKEQITKNKLLQLRQTQARYFSEECLCVSF
jgi:hypothetical protein